MDFDKIFGCASVGSSNKRAKVWRSEGASRADFDKWCTALSSAGFAKKESRAFGDGHKYSAYLKGSDGVFLNYFANIGVLTAVYERECNYFSFSDKPQRQRTDMQITQVHLEDFGASHILRLCDGRFIVFDGGREFERDADRLFACLTEFSVYEKPTVALWIMTHAHEDHHLCFHTLYEKYGDRIKIEKFLLNFPEHDDFEHFESLKYDDPRVERNISEFITIPELWEYMEKSGAEIFMPHTGQCYEVCGVRMEILATLDDIIHNTENNLNAASTVIRMEACGQVILWCADSATSVVKIPDKYRDYLKCDILQVPHHGFGCGRPMQEIEGYIHMRPDVCLLPVAEYHAYNQFCSYKEDTRFLMRDMDVKEFITGDTTVTIPLPYTTPDYRKYKYLEKLSDGIKSNGSKVWVYTGLNTEIAKDLEFCFLNMVNAKATVKAELFFEDAARNLKHITITLNPNSCRKINIVGSEVNDSAKWFNSMSIAVRGVPEGAEFAVRFISDCEIVVSHERIKESYRV